MINGIDVSAYQSTTPNLAGLDFLFARASITTMHRDRITDKPLGVWTDADARYAHFVLAARTAGLVMGAYHFGHTGNIPEQVKGFLAAAGDVDLYALDVEGATAPTQAEAKAFISAVKAAGKVCGLYHSESGFFDAGQSFDWVANWSQVPARHWDFHQYRGSPLDLDHYNGTRSQLDALAKRPTAPDTSTGAPDMLPTSDKTPRLVSTAAPTTFYNLDGTPQPGTHTPQVDVLSPFGTINGFRAIYAGTDIILVKALPNMKPYASDTTHIVKLTVDGVEKASVTV